MSGLNRLFVPDLGDQANLTPLYHSRQANMSAQCDGCHRWTRDGGSDGGKVGEVEREGEVHKGEVMGGEGGSIAKCSLHFVWNGH